MKTVSSLFFGLWLSLMTQASGAAVPRTDINPALLYWQAFAVMPDLPESDQKHLFDSDWRSHPMDERAGQLALRFDPSFRLLRQAAQSRLPCDWGIDLTDGPYVLLPHLAKAKRLVQAAVLRARWSIQAGHPDSTRDDLVASFVLGRSLAHDQVLISGLVQLAIEGIISGYVVQAWPQLPTETLQSILQGIDSAPPRGTMAACMRTEKVALYDWLVHQVDGIRAKYLSDEQAALASISTLLDDIVSEEGLKKKGFGGDVIKASGGSMEGLRQYVAEMAPFYAQLEEVMSLPYPQFGEAIGALQKRIDAHPNLLLHEFLPAVLKVRQKEFRAIARLAMVHAAYQQRVDPANGLQKVPDPFGAGPFEYSRFTLDGTDRGFKLQSQLKVPDFSEAFIFAEKPGPAFIVDGPNAGKPVL